MDCEPRFDYAPQDGRVGVQRAGLPRGGLPRRGLGRGAAPHHRHEHGLRGPARHRAHADEGGRHAVRGAVVVRAPALRRPTRRPTTGSSGRRTTGSTGSTTATSPTTRGAPTSSAAHSRSRGCRTRPPARSWRPRPRRCRRRPAASATGTTASRGSATPRSCSGASTRSASTGRPTTSSTSSRTSRRRRSDELQIMYRIDGEGEIPEFTLDHLSGYEGARPVRIGNGAYKQEQHDVWGALLDSIYLHTKSRNFLPDRIWPIVKKQVERALEKWREPDRGIWEIRGEPKHFTSSKLMCWVAADRGARLARDARASSNTRPAGSRPRTRSRPTSSRTASTSGGVHPALRHRRARRLGAADRCSTASCRPTTSAWCEPSSRSRTS